MLTDKIEPVSRVSDPEHFEKLFLPLMVAGWRNDDSLRSTMDGALHWLDSYIRTGNRNYLVKCADLLWWEFANPSHRAAHYRPDATT